MVLQREVTLDLTDSTTDLTDSATDPAYHSDQQTGLLWAVTEVTDPYQNCLTSAPGSVSFTEVTG